MWAWQQPFLPPNVPRSLNAPPLTVDDVTRNTEASSLLWVVVVVGSCLTLVLMAGSVAPGFCVSALFLLLVGRTGPARAASEPGKWTVHVTSVSFLFAAVDVSRSSSEEEQEFEFSSVWRFGSVLVRADELMVAAQGRCC